MHTVMSGVQFNNAFHLRRFCTIELHNDCELWTEMDAVAFKYTSVCLQRLTKTTKMSEYSDWESKTDLRNTKQTC
jgi:hypothetical protein